MLNDQDMMTWCTSYIMTECGIFCEMYSLQSRLVYQVHTCQKRYEEVV